jgi:hypothetical protein
MYIFRSGIRISVVCVTKLMIYGASVAARLLFLETHLVLADVDFCWSRGCITGIVHHISRKIFLRKERGRQH